MLLEGSQTHKAKREICVSLQELPGDAHMAVLRNIKRWEPYQAYITYITEHQKLRTLKCPAGGEDHIPRKPFLEAALFEIIKKIQPL